MRKFLGSTGATLVQIMIAGSVLMGAGAYLMRSVNYQSKINKMELNRDEAFHQINQISDFLTDYENCAKTFNQSGALTGTLNAILSKSSNVTYAVNTQLTSGKILGFSVTGYAPSTGTVYRELNLRIKFLYRETRINDQGSYGALEKNYDLPVYMITENSSVVTCMTNQAHVIQDAMRQSCTQFGGSFNETSGRCERIHGPNGVVLNFTRDNFCASGPLCPHPNANMACSGLDNRGVGHGNWVVAGFDASAQVQCTCMPRTCWNPADYCLNKDLGTNWCTQDCPRGTWDPQDWSPDPSTQCDGRPFSQANYCGRTRPAVGTYDPGDYAPDPSDVCSGTNYTMTNSCGASLAAIGTKTCP